MFNLGAEKLVVIFFIALLVVGPDKLPDLARKAGRALGDLRRMSGGFQDELRRALDEPLSTFTREFTNPGSTAEASPATTVSDVTEVRSGDAAPPPPSSSEQTDTPAEPALAESSSLAPAGAHGAPEALVAKVQPVPMTLAEAADSSNSLPASRSDADALPAWVFGTQPSTDAPQFH